MSEQAIEVRIQGQSYRIRGDAEEEENIHRLAAYVDATMDKVRERTHTVDSRDVAVLSALNLARELLALKETGVVGQGHARVSTARIQALIERIDAAEQD